MKSVNYAVRLSYFSRAKKDFSKIIVSRFSIFPRHKINPFGVFSDSLVENESLSSGVGTSSHSGSAGSSTTPTESHPPSLILPGMHVVCLENHSSPDPRQLHITQGDIIEGKGPVHFRASRGRLDNNLN